jgi:dipeptidyl aminopeptidase/acylaminoacyl peptidase
MMKILRFAQDDTRPAGRMRFLAALGMTFLLSASAAGQGPTQDYLVFVASEGNDRISLVRYGPRGASVERVSKIGRNPTEPVGPHGIAVSPDGRRYYVTTAHGFPNGELWRYSTTGDSLKGTVKLGSFPATLQISPDGLYAYVVNFNLHGGMKPSSVSVVYLDEIGGGRANHDVHHAARITTRSSRHPPLLGVHDG